MADADNAGRSSLKHLLLLFSLTVSLVERFDMTGEEQKVLQTPFLKAAIEQYGKMRNRSWPRGHERVFHCSENWLKHRPSPASHTAGETALPPASRR